MQYYIKKKITYDLKKDANRFASKAGAHRYVRQRRLICFFQENRGSCERLGPVDAPKALHTMIVFTYDNFLVLLGDSSISLIPASGE